MPNETAASKRYSELCDALQALGPVAGDLVHELDETVGKRLCEAQDAILARPPKP